MKKLGVLLTALSVTTISQAADIIFDPATGSVTIPGVLINGKVEFGNVKLGLNPNGTLSVLSNEEPLASGTTTTYDPTTGTVTIPSVTVGENIEFGNVKLGLNSEGTLSVISTDTPSEGVPVSNTGTTYDIATGTVTVPKVVINDKIEFGNVKLGLNTDGMLSVLSTGGLSVSNNGSTYSFTAGTVTLPELLVNGKIEYGNVKLGFNPDGAFSILPIETSPVELPVTDLSCSQYAEGSSFCSEGKFPTCQPDKSQVSLLQKGMSYEEAVEILGCHGVLTAYTTSYAVYKWGASKWASSRTSVSFRNGAISFITSL